MFQIKRYPNFGPFLSKKASREKNTQNTEAQIYRILTIIIKNSLKKIKRVVWVIDRGPELTFKWKNQKVLLMVRFQLDILTKIKKIKIFKDYIFFQRKGNLYAFFW